MDAKTRYAQALQMSSQRRCTYIISEYLLGRGQRDGLPVLTWTIGDTGGPQITGTSYEVPTVLRRDYITSWAEALDIKLTETTEGGRTTITGSALKTTGYGEAHIALVCDVYDDDQAEAEDNAERHYVLRPPPEGDK
jgi:hypothetical protein